MSYALVPALIPQSRNAIVEFAARVQFAYEIQIDVVDGVFVENVSWPYTPEGDPVSVKNATEMFTLEVDLMVSDPINAAYTWMKAGADMLVFHVESLPLEVFKNFVAGAPKNVSIGVAAHGVTPLETLFAYADLAEYIQVMGIAEIGKQGQPFDRSVCDKIMEIKRAYPALMISVDGSVNEHTIADLKQAGAHRFVCGSAITTAPDPEAAYKNLLSLVN